MQLTKTSYVPTLRWRQGEYQALHRLADALKDRVTPLITIPEVEFDFEEWEPKKSVHQHVFPFAVRFSKKWGTRPAWIGVHSSLSEGKMDDGTDVISFVFEALRKLEANAIPLVRLDQPPSVARAVKKIVKKDNLGVAISISLEDLMSSNPLALVTQVSKRIGVSKPEIDLVVDLGAPNFEPYTALATALAGALAKLGDLSSFRNFILTGSAIPESFGGLAKGEDKIPRHDWLFYRHLALHTPDGMRLPVFGDYTIVHPEFKPMDMRKIKAAGKIIYTTPEICLTRKGGAFRDNPAQMHEHCKSLVESGQFSGAPYSYGDDYIAGCAKQTNGASNMSRWKNVAINHHITHVLNDLSNLVDST